MKIAVFILAFLAFVTLAVQAAVRLAPVDAARWHSDPGLLDADDKRETFPGGIRVVQKFDAPPREVLNQSDAIARDMPRTRIVAGNVDEGMITYETRSAFWGFPDYTTIAADVASDGGTRLRIHARLRFGSSDLGVNRRRVEAWLNRMK